MPFFVPLKEKSMKKQIENIKSITPKKWKNIGRIAGVIAAGAGVVATLPVSGTVAAIALAVAGVGAIVSSMSATKKLKVEDIVTMSLPEIKKLIEALNNKHKLTAHEESLKRVALSIYHA